MFPSPSCAIYQHPLDLLDHFLFSCPPKSWLCSIIFTVNNWVISRPLSLLSTSI
ncbi:hypothetical protein BD408DRAFT_418536 [Parasitella parasitica]|nr:hypothetical protein BD408DRAFT_418536 [Parasitella parasitica]